MSQLSVALRQSQKGSNISQRRLLEKLQSISGAGIFSDHEAVQTAWRICAEAGALPDTAQADRTSAEAQLKGVCDALLIFQLMPLLDAAVHADSFHRCLPGELKQRPLQVVLRWAQCRVEQTRRDLDSLVEPSGYLNLVAREQPRLRTRAASDLALAAAQVDALVTTLRSLPLPTEGGAACVAARVDADASAAAAFADARRLRLLEWSVINGLHAGAAPLSPPTSSSATPLLSHLHAVMNGGGADLWSALLAAPPSARPYASAELLYCLLLEHEQAGASPTPLASEAAALLLPEGHALWLRAAYLALQRRAPQLARRLWAAADRPPPGADRPPPGAERPPLGAERPPLGGAPLAVEEARLAATVGELLLSGESGAEGDLFLSESDGDSLKLPLTAQRKVQALVEQSEGGAYLSAPEQALLLARRDDGVSSAQQRFAALLEACERKGCLPKLARYALLPDELAAFQDFLRQRGTSQRHQLELLLSLTLLQPHAQQLHNAKALAQQMGADLETYTDVAEGPSALLHTLVQLLAPGEWERA